MTSRRSSRSGPDSAAPTRSGATKKTSEEATDSRAALSRAALLSSARGLFAERGYTATSVNDIVEAAGTSVGLLYYHFEGKHAIFDALFDDYQRAQEQATHDAVTQARASGESNGEQLLLVGMRAYLDGAWKERQLIPIIYGHDRPATFQHKLDQASTLWTRQNRLLLNRVDPALVDTLTSLLRSSLIGLITDVAASRTARQARTTIEQGTHLVGLMLAQAAVQDR